jgi:hypothetical protein
MQGMMYTYVSPDGEIWWSDWHDTMEDAYREAVEMYGDGVLIREVWYKEWICGFYEPGKQCGYDKYGRHVTEEEMEKAGGEGPADSPTNSEAITLPTINTMKAARERMNANV